VAIRRDGPAKGGDSSRITAEIDVLPTLGERYAL